MTRKEFFIKITLFFLIIGFCVSIIIFLMSNREFHIELIEVDSQIIDIQSVELESSFLYAGKYPRIYYIDSIGLPRSVRILNFDNIFIDFFDLPKKAKLVEVVEFHNGQYFDSEYKLVPID